MDKETMTAFSITYIGIAVVLLNQEFVYSHVLVLLSAAVFGCLGIFGILVRVFGDPDDSWAKEVQD